MKKMEKPVATYWPFRRDPYGQYTLAPYGRFGACYTVPGEAAYRRLKPELLGQYWGLFLLFLQVSIAGLSLVFPSLEAHSALSYLAALLLGLSVYPFYIVWATKSLTLIAEAPPFLPAFRSWADDAKPVALWGVQLACLSLVIFILRTPPRTPLTLLEYFTGCLYMVLVTLVMLVCSAALIVRRRRIALRR